MSRVMFSCLLGCLLGVGMMFASDGLLADAAKPVVEGKAVEHAIAGTELSAVEVNGNNACLSRCEEGRKVIFKRCRAEGVDAKTCVVRAKRFARRCRVRLCNP